MTGFLSWTQVALTAFSALAGGFIGGLVVAFRIGSWRQSMEDRVTVVERRLESGDPHVGKVPLLDERTRTILEEIREIKAALRDMRDAYVSHEECDRTHGRNP